MKTLFSVSVVVLAVLLLGACKDTSTTPTTTTGEIYGYVKLFNEYEIQLTDQSGLTAQILEDGKVLQTVSTTPDGMFSFKAVQAGVYDFRLFKSGYIFNPFYEPTDTLSWSNSQFVGSSRLLISNRNAGFYSVAEPDTSYWLIKPDIHFEIIKQVINVNDIWLRDSLIGGKQTYIYGSGTKETRKVRFTVNFERELPQPEMKRTVKLAIQNDNRTYTNDFIFTTDANILTGVYEYNCPNAIVRDSLGKIIYYIERPGSTSKTEVKEITVQASSPILNGIKNKRDPKRYAKTKELKLSLID